MNLENYKEGKSMQRPPLFEANCFVYWKNRFETYVKSKDIDLWYIIVYGNYKPTIKDKDGKDVIITYEKYDENHKKMISKNDEAKLVLYNALPKKEYERIFMCDTAQDILKYFIITHQGNKQVKDNKIDLFVQKYEEFIITDDGTIDCSFARFNTIITSLKALDGSFSSRNHVRKFLRARPKDLEISKSKKEKYKSLALKERKVLSEEEATSSNSDDEEYAMTCGDLNHFISDCPKHSFNDQKAFVVGCWSDSGDDSKKEEICLMALDNNEVKLELNEWIKDCGCSRHMTSNKDLFSSYKTIDGGNVVFGGNTKSKIVRKGQICDKKCKVLFSETGSEIIKDDITIGRGNRKNGLYIMKMGNSSKDSLCLTSIDDTSTLWHRRLGHANMRLIQSLSSKELVRNLPKLKFEIQFCDACNIGK
ncbi:retrovirus-related pol polyprotein from transposon TNT 1-94 [Tanacetum coccineum]